MVPQSTRWMTKGAPPCATQPSMAALTAYTSWGTTTPTPSMRTMRATTLCRLLRMPADLRPPTTSGSCSRWGLTCQCMQGSTACRPAAIWHAPVRPGHSWQHCPARPAPTGLSDAPATWQFDAVAHPSSCSHCLQRQRLREMRQQRKAEARAVAAVVDADALAEQEAKALELQVRGTTAWGCTGSPYQSASA